MKQQGQQTGQSGHAEQTTEEPMYQQPGEATRQAMAGRQSGQTHQQSTGQQSGQRSQHSSGQQSHQGQVRQQSAARQSGQSHQQQPIGQQSGQRPQGQQQTGQQSQMGGHSQMQQRGQRLQDVQSPQHEAAMDYVARAIQVCEWCADQCVQEANPNMRECIQLCEDVSELGETVLALVPRQSRYAPTILQTFDQAARACAQECSQHQAAHCQDCAEVLGQTANAVGQFLQEYQQRPTAR